MEEELEKQRILTRDTISSARLLEEVSEKKELPHWTTGRGFGSLQQIWYLPGQDKDLVRQFQSCIL
jgi:hypothetical protein